jgi:hypothetical protein
VLAENNEINITLSDGLPLKNETHIYPGNIRSDKDILHSDDNDNNITQRIFDNFRMHLEDLFNIVLH